MKDTLQRLVTDLTERLDRLQSILSAEKDKAKQMVILDHMSYLARRRNQIIDESGVI